MEITIGPYKLYQRTEFSKIQLYNNEDDEIIQEDSSEFIEKILDNYNKQISDPIRYFDIKDVKLDTITENAIEDNLDYIFIPNGITQVGERAVRAQIVELINLPDSLKIIDEFAFHRCYNLRYIKIPESVSEIKSHCFCNCSSLKKVILPNIEILESGVFNDCQSLRKINLPESLHTIESSCFNWCLSLDNIVIPDSVKEIGDSVFHNCISLKHIELPNALKTIEEYTFASCISLEEIKIPDTVTKIGNEAFANTESLNSITLPRDLNTIGWRPFSRSKAKTLIFNHNLRELNGTHNGQSNSLIENSNIDKLVINKNVTTITPAAIGVYGRQISKIDYNGTESELEEFMRNNDRLFDLLININEINFLEENTKELSIEIEER